jgi:FkbM family methyltransferase
LTSSGSASPPDDGQPALKISYAQNGEDVRAWRALRHVEDPFYVEVGASDPLVDSVTAALSNAGWRGILVEAEPVIAEALRRSRPRDVVVAAAAHNRSGVLTFSYAGVRGQGQVSDHGVPTAPAPAEGPRPRGHHISVPAVRLADVLADVAPPEVHFMSVDVEGHELEALEGLELTRWRPWVLCVEATEPDSRTPAHERWEPLLLDADYRFVTVDGPNRWYVAAEHADLAGVVVEPYNALDEIIDGWRRREVVVLQGDVERMRGELAGLQARIQKLHGQAHQLSGALTAAEQAQEELTGQLRRSEDETGRLRRELRASQSAHAEQLHRVERERAEAVQRLERELALVAHERDLASARERVMLESKSWRVTSPLRTIRWRAGLAVQGRRQASAVAALPSPTDLAAPPPASPADVRRRTALHARLEAASRRAAHR